MWSVGISVSPCTEAARIGYDERQINRIVIRMAQYFLDRNMRVIFGHDWRENGVMRAVADFAEVVAARAQTVDGRSHSNQHANEESSHGNQLGIKKNTAEPRMLNVVPMETKSLSRTALEACRDSGGVLDVIPTRVQTQHLLKRLPEAEFLCHRYLKKLQGPSGRAAELTALRHCITVLLRPGCRICLGGKTTGYSGRYPGVMEEGMLALHYDKPLYLLGGFGGATRNVARCQKYWNNFNGLNSEQKRELFKTTDVEYALRLIFGGIEALE